MSERTSTKHSQHARQWVRHAALPPTPAGTLSCLHLLTLAALTSLQALSRPNPCWWLWLKPASLVTQSAWRSWY